MAGARTEWRNQFVLGRFALVKGGSEYTNINVFVVLYKVTFDTFDPVGYLE